MPRMGDLWASALEKLGRGEQLTSQELDAIRLQGNLTDSNNAYVAGLQNGVSDINAGAIRGEYNISPAAGAFLLKDTAQTGVGTAAYVPVSFNSAETYRRFTWASSDPTKLYVKGSM